MSMKLGLTIDLPPRSSSPPLVQCLDSGSCGSFEGCCADLYWLLPNVLCGMGCPCCRECIRELDENNVGLLVSLTEDHDKSVPISWFADTAVQSLRLPVRDFQVPTMLQVEQFVNEAREVMDTEHAVCVHCYRGWGRTAVMLACFLVSERECTPQEAIEGVKSVQPNAFCTLSQEAFVQEYYHHVS